MRHTLEIERLSFSYPDGRQALREVSLKIGPGEKVALVGPNGAGKSTLLLHLNGILRPQTGKVYACGFDLADNRMLGQARAAVGMVFQNPDDQLFSPTVFDDVAYGLIYQGLAEPEVCARVTAALAEVSMDGYAERVPHHLSPGEKKRVAIATVLAMHPEILVLDEPTGGLDPCGRRSLIRLLQQLPQTMLVTTHDLAMVKELFPRTVVINGGELVADGATLEILRDADFLMMHGLCA